MIVYKITNRKNGNVYIGQTVKSLKQRWAQCCAPSSGCNALHNAILKHGTDAFQVEIFPSRKHLAEKLEVNPAAITNSIKRGTRCRGLHYEYVEQSA